MRALAVLIIFCLLSCKSTAQMKNNELMTCKQDVIIIQTETIEMIMAYLDEDDFYLEGKSQYYMYEIILDDNLEIKKVNTVFENNETYSNELISLVQKLSFQKIGEKKECHEYILPFIIHARLKKLIYPKDSTFYEVALPIE